jgi:hypothetical protein
MVRPEIVVFYDGRIALPQIDSNKNKFFRQTLPDRLQIDKQLIRPTPMQPIGNMVSQM